MPRTHSLQARSGASAALHIRVPDMELARLERLARREGPGTTVSSLVRRAITSHLAFSSGRSPFLDVFGHLLGDLADVGVHPIVVGTWAAAAHGYLTPTESFDVVIRDSEVPQLRDFLQARGMPEPGASLPFTIGRRPWRVRFALALDGVPAAALPTVKVAWDAVSLEVITLEGLIEHGAASLPEHVMDALQELKAGTHPLDDGERGLIAWDAVGRFTASAFYADPMTRSPHRFVDFRLVQAT